MPDQQVGLCQRAFDSNTGLSRYVFRNFVVAPDRYDALFNVTIDASGQLLGQFKHGTEVEWPFPNEVVQVTATGISGSVTGITVPLTLQPYKLVCPDFKISHCFHEPDTEVVWAIADTNDGNQVCILRSEDYFETTEPVYAWPAGDFGDLYRAMYIDKFGNIIVGARPSPLISRDQGQTWQNLNFKWQDENHGILCPFWNITESETEDLLVISEYGNSLFDTQPHGSHRGTFWSYDSERKHWVPRPVDRSFDQSDYLKFSGYFRHIHGYHINPIIPNVHLMFLGDPVKDSNSDGTPGYYVSQDGGRTWSTECLTEYDHSYFYNGPCFVTWWPGGKAFITSDTAATGHAYWWGNGPQTGVGQDAWGGPGLRYPEIELQRVDEESSWPETPWMAMAVRETYETYCTTAVSETPYKEVVWRYDGNAADQGNSGIVTVLAENYVDDSFVTLRWLSGSRGNMIPPQAKYFFTTGGRRFPRQT